MITRFKLAGKVLQLQEAGDCRAENGLQLLKLIRRTIPIAIGII